MMRKLLAALIPHPRRLLEEYREHNRPITEAAERRRAMSEPDPRSEGRRVLVGFLIGGVLALVIGLYLHGTFDRALYGAGLNHHECARNGFGATFCGRELDEYRERTRPLTEAAEQLKGVSP
jgi:hypothetical protein